MSRFAEFTVSRTYEDKVEPHAQVVSGVLAGREVQVHYLELSGEFQLVAGNQRRTLDSEELNELAGVMRRFQHYLPWVNGAAGTIMMGLNEALGPSALTGFVLRSVSELGHLILLAGRSARGDVDVVYDTAVRRVTVLEASQGRGSVKRPLTARERTELRDVLERCVSRRLVERTERLLRDVLAVVATH